MEPLFSFDGDDVCMRSSGDVTWKNWLFLICTLDSESGTQVRQKENHRRKDFQHRYMQTCENIHKLSHHLLTSIENVIGRADYESDTRKYDKYPASCNWRISSTRHLSFTLTSFQVFAFKPRPWRLRLGASLLSELGLQVLSPQMPWSKRKPSIQSVSLIEDQSLVEHGIFLSPFLQD